MSSTFISNNKNIKILTDKGFVSFTGITKKPIRSIYKVLFTDATFIEASANHVFFTEDSREIYLHELEPGVVLLGITNKTVLEVEYVTKQETYDIVNSENHTYFANGILCHNCDFLSSDALLISSIFLAEITPTIEKIKPISVVKDVVFWYDVKPSCTYLIGVDPSQGTGKDFTVISVYEFPIMRQIAEYRSNSMSPTDMYRVLKNLLIYLENKGATIYFSVENNGVGSGIISAFEMDENAPTNSEFVSEDGKGRLGMVTTAKSKMKACINLKEMLEKRAMTITSPVLLRELKSFSRSRSAYAAQLGSTDDCISATLIVIRIVESISSFDQHAFEKLHSQNDIDPWSDEDVQKYDESNGDDAPMPIIM